MIIKVQIALSSSIKDPPALVYNKDRSFEAQMPVTKELGKLMGDSPRKFFEVKINGDFIDFVKEVEGFPPA